ncbi:hypothetical protein AQUCO_03100087v1 [Aquilegia coerulea]|uniref:WPP domain-containing protein n=1 Tax=Aquilegia coerulea TaxID=218851 RepID=A0A2G5D0P6_AQUCA|nr:hypothetical protein AQUCO_03100087v1 [Aquilegia coerulea]
MPFQEIQKFEEIGRVPTSFADNLSTEPTLHEVCTFHDPTISEYNLYGKLHVDAKEQSGNGPQEVQLTKLHREIYMLKTKLEVVSATIETKENQITELESVLNGSGILHEASVSTSPSLQNECGEMEIELQDLLKKKIEFEVEYVIVLRTAQRLSVATENQISPFEDQKQLALEQIQMLQKLKEAEHKAIVLKSQAEELKVSCKELVATEEILKTQNSLYAHTLYFTAQFILFLLVFVVFILRPRGSAVAPT